MNRYFPDLEDAPGLTACSVRGSREYLYLVGAQAAASALNAIRGSVKAALLTDWRRGPRCTRGHYYEGRKEGRKEAQEVVCSNK